MTSSPRGRRATCHGLPPLTARLESWQETLLTDSEPLASLVETFGSPLNLHHVDPFERNVRKLLDVARSRRFAESDALASVKRANEDPGPQPPVPLRVGAAGAPLGRWFAST